MMQDTGTNLTYDSMLTDPMIRLVMDADRVTVADLIAVLSAAARGNGWRPMSAPMPVAA